MVYDASDVPLFDAAIQQVASKNIPDNFFARDPVSSLSHTFVHDGTQCKLSVTTGSTAIRHERLQTVGSHYELLFTMPNGSERSYSFCIVEPTDDHAANRRCALQCLHVLKTVGGTRFSQVKLQE